MDAQHTHTHFKMSPRLEALAIFTFELGKDALDIFGFLAGKEALDIFDF